MLFTDIEGSTRLAASLGSGWAEVLADHHEIVDGTVRSHGGWIDGVAGDGFFVTFSDVRAAAQAAVSAQRRLRAHAWPDRVGELRVRMGLHVGQVERRGRGYLGLEVHRASRVGAAAHGGELLMTGVAAELAHDVVASQPLGAHRLKDFPTPVALFCAVIDGRGAADFPPPRTLELRPGNVPAGPPVLVGRGTDLARVRSALLEDDERLVTALGRGGMGKTSLALAVAGELLDEFPGGVWWVDASQERDVEGLRSAIARSCRISTPGPFEEWLETGLGSLGATLLVLDNLEVVVGAGGFVEALQRRLPDLRVLATSQLPLGCRHERRVPLDSLSASDGIELLRRTAERLEIPLEDDPACADLVALLDGLPLAIELAAGRLRLFGPAELVERLRGSTTILRDRSGHRPDRQRSLQAALEWSLDLLEPEARELFARLGAFAGPVELGEIEAVVGGDDLDVLAAVEALLDVALLRRVETGDGRARFGLPEAVRQEAARRLDSGAGDVWRAAHAQRQRDLVWPVRFFEIVELSLVQTARQAAAETIRALEWAWEHDHELARELALGRAPLAVSSGSFREMSTLVDRVLADPGDDPEVVDFARVVALARDAYAGARDDLESRGRSLLSEIEDAHARLLCLVNLMVGCVQDGRPQDGLPEIERAVTLARELGPVAYASMLAAQAALLVEIGRYDAADAVIAECEQAAGSLRSTVLRRIDLTRAELALARGEVAGALDWFARALTTAELAADHTEMHVIMMLLLRAFARVGRDRAMLEVYGISLAQADERSEQGMTGLLGWREPEPAVAEALTRLGPEGVAIVDAGRALAPDQRVKRVCALAFAS
jgi:predicted ATPase/class 3 adenylate cyclase